MNNQSSEIRVVQPIPVSVSLVVICDIRVLTLKTDDEFCFPYDFSNGSITLQKLASLILFGAVGEMLAPKKWLPVDVRSSPDRSSPHDIYSVDVGYMTILDLVDIPMVKSEAFNWQLVNLDESSFPVTLVPDHECLWNAARDMLNILK